jgi:UDP-glucose 4-epimerase
MSGVLVTGGAGFIGSNLVRVLERRGHSVSVIDDLSTGREENLSGCSARLFRNTILDSAALDEACIGVEAVVHLAALPSVARSLIDPIGCHEVNSTGTLQLLEAARRADCRHVVLASSSSVYGANPVLPKIESLVPVPVSPYAASKLSGEAYGLAYASCFGMRILALRFFNVYGPAQPPDHAYAAVIPRFISAAMSGKPLPIHGDGLQTRDFTYVGSVVELVARSIEDRIMFEGPVNMAFGTRASLIDVASSLEVILARKLEREHLPSRVGDVRDSQADTARLFSLFPHAEAVPLSVGLRHTVDWFLGHARRDPEGLEGP